MSFCICDTHNFTRMNEEFLEENPDAEIADIPVISFESVLKERQDEAVDRTFKPHEEPPPKKV